MNYHALRCTAEEVRAILAETKTRISRPIKPQPTGGEVPSRIVCEWYHPTRVDRHSEECLGRRVFSFTSEGQGWLSPFGGPGDRLWVQEKWRCTGGGDQFGIVYGADESPELASYRRLSLDSLGRKWLLGEHIEDWKRLVGETRISTGWRQSSHMPRWASRITLKVKRVWVEWDEDPWVFAAECSLVENTKARE